MAALRIFSVVALFVVAAPRGAGAQDETVIYYHLDAIGSVRMVTDAAGQVVARYDFLPFGERWGGPADAHERQFAGTERDAETGLDYFGARYYDSGTGRFTSPDTFLDLDKAIHAPSLWNRYAYVSNNPLRRIDPDGRWEREIHYELTRLLAVAAGFDSADAREIATWNARADSDPDKTPMTLFSVDQRKRYHFTTLERRMELSRAALDSGSLSDLGLFLHAEQDSFSHFGYGPALGHFFAGHRPDQTWLRPRRADAMAEDSYAWLRRARGSGDAIPWGKLAPLVHRVNIAMSPRDREQRLRELQAFIDAY